MTQDAICTCSCTYMTTVGVKELNSLLWRRYFSLASPQAKLCGVRYCRTSLSVCIHLRGIITPKIRLHCSWFVLLRYTGLIFPRLARSSFWKSLATSQSLGKERLGRCILARPWVMA